MYLLMRKKAEFVMRVSSNAHGAVTKFLESPVDDTIAAPVSVVSFREKIKGCRLSDRYGQTLESPLGQGDFEDGSNGGLGHEFIRRANLREGGFEEGLRVAWGIETYYGDVKEKLQSGQFGGVRRVCVEQDFAANPFPDSWL